MVKKIVVSVLILSVASGCTAVKWGLRIVAVPLAKHLLFDRGHETQDSNEESEENSQ